jgi:hypothetical protein
VRFDRLAITCIAVPHYIAAYRCIAGAVLCGAHMLLVNLNSTLQLFRTATVEVAATCCYVYCCVQVSLAAYAAANCL